MRNICRSGIILAAVAAILVAVSGGCQGMMRQITGKPAPQTRRDCPQTADRPYGSLKLEPLSSVALDDEATAAVNYRLLAGFHPRSSLGTCPPAPVSDMEITLLWTPTREPVAHVDVRGGEFTVRAADVIPTMMGADGQFEIQLGRSAMEHRDVMGNPEPVTFQIPEFAALVTQARERAAAEKARVEQEQREAAARKRQEYWARVSELGLEQWGGHCRRIELMMKGACNEFDGAVARGECEAAQKTAVKQKYTFFLDPEEVRHSVDYDAKKRVFRVSVSHLLTADVELEDCSDGMCRGETVSTKPMKTANGSAKFPVWEKRIWDALGKMDKPLETFEIPVDEVSSPDDLEHQLKIHVLVQPIDTQTIDVGSWFYYRNVRVRVVGMQALTPDLDWGRMLIKPKGTMAGGACPSPIFAGRP